MPNDTKSQLNVKREDLYADFPQRVLDMPDGKVRFANLGGVEILIEGHTTAFGREYLKQAKRLEEAIFHGTTIPRTDID